MVVVVVLLVMMIFVVVIVVVVVVVGIGGVREGMEVALGREWREKGREEEGLVAKWREFE